MGKSFRNEVSPGNFLFRMREFEQMELEFFCEPEEANKWYSFTHLPTPPINQSINQSNNS